MSAPHPKPDRLSALEHRPGRHPPGRSGKQDLGKLAGTLALITGGLAMLVLGIAIGYAARKRLHRWGHAYLAISS
jgi:hypothetical protein